MKAYLVSRYKRPMQVGEVAPARVAIAGRYLGVEDGERFAVERRSKPGVLLRLVHDSPRLWDLSGTLPS